jgi:hypothetical protein
MTVTDQDNPGGMVSTRREGSYTVGKITSFMVPTAYILSTSDRRPLILMRMFVPFSITCSPLSVHCGGVAFASKVISEGIIYMALVARHLYVVRSKPYIASHESLQRAAINKEARTKNRRDYTVHLDHGQL